MKLQVYRLNKGELCDFEVHDGEVPYIMRADGCFKSETPHCGAVNVPLYPTGEVGMYSLDFDRMVIISGWDNNFGVVGFKQNVI